MVKAFQKLFIAFAFLVLTGYVGNLLLDNPYMHGLIRKTINHQLEDYTHLKLKFEAVGAKFMPPGIEIYGAEIEDKEGKDLFRVAHMKASLSFAALLFSRNEIFDLELTEPKVNLPIPPIEQLLRMEKFPELLEPSGPVYWPPKKSLPLHRLAITNGQVSYRMIEEGKERITLQASALDAEVNFRSWNSYRIMINAGNTDFALDGEPILYDTKIDLRLKNTKEGLVSEVFRVDSQDMVSLGQLDLNFELGPQKVEGRLLKGLTLKAEHKIRNLSLAPIKRLLKDEATDGAIQGSVDFQMHIPLDDRKLDWALEGDIEAKDARIVGFKLHETKAALSVRQAGLSLDKISVIKDGEELAKGKGSIGFTGEMPMEFDVQPLGLTMEELMEMLQVDDFTAFEATLAKTNLKLSGQISPFHLAIRGPIVFDKLTFPFVKDLGESYPVPPRCDLDAIIKVTSDVVTIEKGEGDCIALPPAPPGKSPLDIKGSISFATETGLNLGIKSPALDASLLNHFIKLPSQGSVATKVQIFGPYDKLKVKGEADAKTLNVSGLDLSNVAADFELPIEENLIRVENVSASVGEGSIKIPRLQIGFDENLSFETEVDIKRVSAQSMATFFQKLTGGPSLKIGIDSFRGKLQGELLKPFRYRGQADINLKEVGYGPETFLTDLKTRFHGTSAGQEFRDGIVRLDRIEARFSVESEYGKAKNPWEVPFGLKEFGVDEKTNFRVGLHTTNKIDDHFRSNIINADEDHLRSLPYAGAWLAEQKIGGLIDLDTDLEGPLGRLQGKVDGALQRPYLFGMPIPSISFSGFLDGTKLQLPEFRHAGNSLVGRLNIDFGKPELPYDFFVYLKQFDARSIPGKFFADDARNYAYLTAEWTMRGALNDFWKSRGELVFIDLKSKLYRNLGSRTTALELNSSQPVKIEISPERWTFEGNKPLKFHGDYFELEISTGQNRLPNNLDIKVHGSLKLDILKNFTGLTETARGELILDGYLRGSIDAPEYSMRITERKLDPFNVKEWNPVAIGLVNLGPALSSVSLDVEVKQDRLIVNRFRANKGREGAIDIAGTLLFNPSGKDVSHLLINLDRIEFNRLQIPVLKSADTVVSGDLIMSGNGFPFNLSGNLKLDRFQSIGSFDLRREIVSALYETKLFASGGGSDSPPQNYLNLDVGLTADRSILVKNKTIEAVLSAQLKIRGTDTQPLLLGQVIADSGTFNYRRGFRITQAVVSFDEPVSPPNPRLDIGGEATINPYKVNIQVGGYLSAPKVTLAADPPTREDGTAISNLDILLLITTGKISESSNNNKSAENAGVNELFSSFLVFAEEPIEKLFDLSGQTVVREVYIDSYIPEENSKNTTNNKSGQQRPITRFNIPFNLFNAANAVVQVDDEANSKILFEYPLHEGITFTGSLDRKANKRTDSENNLPNDTGFDLKFRFGFD